MNFLLICVCLIFASSSKSVMYYRVTRCIDPSTSFNTSLETFSEDQEIIYLTNSLNGNTTPTSHRHFSETEDLLEHNINAIPTANSTTPSTSAQATPTTTIPNNSIVTPICKSWSEQTNIYYSSSGYCFPGKTNVLSRRGPIQLSALKLGDELLSYDPATGHSIYSPVISWLQRDPLSVQQFVEISTNSSQIYFASKSHNVAVSNNDKLEFKFAEDLLNGDSLFTIGADQLEVEKTALKYEAGLYAPYTEIGTFYIFPDEDTTADSNLLLVHCLAKVMNPAESNSIAYKAISVYNFFLSAYEPHDDEEYTHAVLQYDHWLFGSSHREGTVSHKYSSSSSSSQRQRQRQNKRNMVATAEALLSMTQMWNL